MVAILKLFSVHNRFEQWANILFITGAMFLIVRERGYKWKWGKTEMNPVMLN